MTVFQVDDPLFKTKPLFVMGCTFAEFTRYMHRHFRQVSVGLDVQQAGQMLTYDRPPWRIVWVQHYPDTWAHLGCLVHETFHLVTRICQDKGIPIKAQIEDGNGDEPAAYLLDYFVREAMRRSGVRLLVRR
jgi:hypothetical protein